MNNIVHLINTEKKEKMFSPDSVAYRAICLGLNVDATLEQYCGLHSEHFKAMFGFQFGKACSSYTAQYIETKFDDDAAIIAATKHFGKIVQHLSDIEFTCSISTLHDEVTNLTKHHGNKLYLTHLIITALNQCFLYQPKRKKMVANLFEVYSF